MDWPEDGVDNCAPSKSSRSPQAALGGDYGERYYAAFLRDTHATMSSRLHQMRRVSSDCEIR